MITSHGFTSFPKVTFYYTGYLRTLNKMLHINFIHITSITSDIKGYIIDIDLNEFRA